MIRVKIEVAPGLRKRGKTTMRQAISSLAAGIALELAQAAKRRVMRRGDLGDQRFPGWTTSQKRSRRPRPKYVSPRYPDIATGEITRTGSERFARNDLYYQLNGTIPGSYDNTRGRGMWSGFTTMVRGTTFAENLFRGRSEGQESRIRGGKVRPIKESNALKAWTVLNKHGVHVHAPSDRELEAVAYGVTEAMAIGVGAHLEVRWRGKGPQAAEALEAIRFALRRSGQV